ncbi:hypothetical protein [Lentibacter sp. XHP0401]|uniref:hypothetical protein n=1 Tax=Lentibacter sp. XHP0401 TaxID=2984334 RepID=UPI0021E90881|nr:hypothetical protein [Lentibacter sp. XHP0401]MCV2894647.1 hypothetical protein [Lentibacter sp. XHP0401]
MLPETLVGADGAVENRHGVTSVFDGPAPMIRVFDDPKTEISELETWVANLLLAGVMREEIAILVRLEV